MPNNLLNLYTFFQPPPPSNNKEVYFSLMIQQKYLIPKMIKLFPSSKFILQLDTIYLYCFLSKLQICLYFVVELPLRNNIESISVADAFHVCGQLFGDCTQKQLHISQNSCTTIPCFFEERNRCQTSRMTDSVVSLVANEYRKNGLSYVHNLLRYNVTFEECSIKGIMNRSS